MEMRMVEQGLPPGMQHGKKADLGPEVLGIGGDRTQGLRGGPEQQAIKHRLILIG
jgi:hypothetical protein